MVKLALLQSFHFKLQNLSTTRSEDLLYRVWHYPGFQASSGDLGMYFPQIRGLLYCKISIPRIYSEPVWILLRASIHISHFRVTYCSISIIYLPTLCHFWNQHVFILVSLHPNSITHGNHSLIRNVFINQYLLSTYYFASFMQPITHMYC